MIEYTEPSDFTKGEAVVWRPQNQDGVVTSTNDFYVFVNFDPTKPYGVACYPRDLEKQNEIL